MDNIYVMSKQELAKWLAARGVEVDPSRKTKGQLLAMAAQYSHMTCVMNGYKRS